MRFRGEYFVIRLMGIIALAFCASAAPAMALDINGAMILQYTDREGGTALNAGTQNEHFRFVQSALFLREDLDELNKAGATISLGPAASNISEAFLSFGGLPYEGEITVGRFFKPLGEPLQTIGLSYPALLFHTSSVTGARIGMEQSSFRWQIGAVNDNPLSATGTVISGSSTWGRPQPAGGAFNTNHKELYAFLGWQNGGSWGSLDLNATYTYGSMTQADRNTLNNALIAGDPLRGQADQKLRDGVNLAADYTYGPFRLYGEYARFDEGKLNLKAYNISSSYRTGPFNLIVAYDRLSNNVSLRPQTSPQLWHRQRWSYSVAYDFHPRLQFQLEYEHNNENSTSAAKEIPNDAVLFQILGTF